MNSRTAKVILYWGMALLAASRLMAAAPSRELTRAEQEFFESRVRPIFTDHCFKCHSAKAEKVKGGLLLDSREGWMKGGDSGPVITPGEPDKSKLILAVRHTDEDTAMPPKEALSPEQIADLETWVRMGAPDPRTKSTSGLVYNAVEDVPKARQAWPYTPITDPPPPKVRNKDWPRDPLDHFILVRLEAEKLAPVPPAEKLALLRRASFDLTGLPPSPEAIQQFLADESPDAFAHLVDRLLASPQFGERWGRHWLDIARYADSNGLEFNLNYDNAWRYRDYVIESFNKDKPFNLFIREQIAGDLLPYDTGEQHVERVIATGFLNLGPKVLGEPNRVKLTMDIVDEQIDVTTRGFLGLTVSCARCHDHKFDPIPTRDYYALAGIFKSTATLAGQQAEQAQPFPIRWMERPLGSPEQMKVVEEYDAKVTRLAQEIRELRQAKFKLPGLVDSGALKGIIVDNKMAELTGPWKSSIYSTNHFVDKDYLQDGNADKGKKSVRFVPNLPKAGQYEVRISYAASYNRATNVPVTIQSAGDSKTILVNQREVPPVEGVFLSLGTYQFEAGTNGAVVVSNEGTRGFVVADAVQFLPVGEMAMMAANNSPPVKPANSAPSMTVKLEGDPDALQDQLFDLQDKAPPRPEVAMAVAEGTIGNSKIHPRGDPQKTGDEVPRGFLQVAFQPGQKPPVIPEAESGRLELADWIASPDNPLTARVAVNRIWLHLFGRGLVNTPDNFGNQAERPTHPELLDYLARRFIALGWSHKKLIREIMLSSAYQMSSGFNAAAYEKDPDNKLVWHMARRRLEAEAIRDAILSVSGQLDLKAGGPALASDRDLARPVPTMAAMPTTTGNRRSVYVPVLRNNVLDMFQLFDFADPHVISGRRNTTSAPTQALFMMNSPFMLDQSKAAAERLLALGDPAERVKTAYLRALGREPDAGEVKGALKFVSDYASQMEKTEAADDVRQSRAWQSFCHALFASTEFRFID